MTENEYPITIEHLKANCPEWVNWIAADEDNEVYLYENRPEREENHFEPSSKWRCERVNLLTITPWYSDWRESLVEVVREPDYSEWIGKLCRFWDGDDDGGDICDWTCGVLSSVLPMPEKSPFVARLNWAWQHCRPLTREEALALVKE